MQKSLIEFDDVLLAQLERQIWFWEMRLSFAEIFVGQGRQLIWHFKMSEMERFRQVRSGRGQENLRGPLQTVENINN